MSTMEMQQHFGPPSQPPIVVDATTPGADGMNALCAGGEGCVKADYEKFSVEAQTEYDKQRAEYEVLVQKGLAGRQYA